jgi:hypothetical protein
MGGQSFKRYKIYPAPLPGADATQSSLPGQPASRYKGILEEAWEFKANMRQRRAEINAEQEAARLAAAKAEAKAAKKKRSKPVRINREPSKLGVALKDWWNFQKEQLRYYCCCWKNLQQSFVPTICCLRSEVDDNAYTRPNE